MELKQTFEVPSEDELNALIAEASKVFKANFPATTWFERSIFINWTCGIADCKYCYLSTVPKKNMKALRSKESILAETIICKAMGWEIGYITGGLRVESTEYLIDLIKQMNLVVQKKIMMNFGPYGEAEILKLKPHISGMGVAIESFDEELHNFICPSKPLKSLMNTLRVLKEQGLKKIITIILGLGEKKDDIQKVVEKVNEYGIDIVQLCFLKPQEGTIFSKTPPPNPQYMASWIAKLRIACPKLTIKVALVKERIEDVSLYLNAGVNCFSRFMVFHDFATPLAIQLEEECKKANRELKGNFTNLPKIDVKQLVESTSLNEEMKKKVLPKAEQYYKKLNDLFVS